MKKSYKGLVIWSLIMLAGVLGLSFLPIGESLLIRLIFNFCNITFTSLMVIIYFTEAVYWINSISYDTALNAGSARRKIFAFKYIVRFGIFTVFYLIFSFISYFIGLKFFVDVIVFTIGTLITAISTSIVRL